MALSTLDARPLVSRSFGLLAFLLQGAITACGFEYDGRLLWPDLEEMGARVLAIAEPGVALRLLEVKADDSVAFEMGEDAEVLLFDYRCADPEALGYRRIGGEALEATSDAIRAPDRILHLDGTEPLALVELAPDELPEIFERALPELHVPSLCRSFEAVPLPIAIMAPLNARFISRLPDGSVLAVFSRWIDRGPATAYRIRGPNDVETIELPEGVPHESGFVDANDRLWLHSRADGLMYGPPDELAAASETWARIPAGPIAHPCDVPGGGGADHSTFAVLTGTGTAADVLTVDGSGTVLRFHDDAWTVLADPVGEGRRDYTCRVNRIDVSWLGPDRALFINAALGAGEWLVARLELNAGLPARFVDDGLPASESAVTRLAERPDGTLIAGGANGYLALRREESWRVIDPPARFVGELNLLQSGPGGSLLLGNATHGLVQHWPDASGGAVACETHVVNTTTNDVRVLGEDFVVALPEGRSTTRNVEAWRLRPAGLCEVPAN